MAKITEERRGLWIRPPKVGRGNNPAPYTFTKGVDDWPYCNNSKCSCYGNPYKARERTSCSRPDCGHVRYRCPACLQTFVDESNLICNECKPVECASCSSLLRKGTRIDTTNDLYCNYCAAEELHYGYTEDKSPESSDYIDKGTNYKKCLHKACENLVYELNDTDFCKSCIIKLQDGRCLMCEREVHTNQSDAYSTEGLCNDCYFETLPNSTKFKVLENHYPVNGHELCSACSKNLVNDKEFVCNYCTGKGTDIKLGEEIRNR